VSTLNSPTSPFSPGEEGEGEEGEERRWEGSGTGNGNGRGSVFEWGGQHSVLGGGATDAGDGFMEQGVNTSSSTNSRLVAQVTESVLHVLAVRQMEYFQQQQQYYEEGGVEEEEEEEEEGGGESVDVGDENDLLAEEECYQQQQQQQQAFPPLSAFHLPGGTRVEPIVVVWVRAGCLFLPLPPHHHPPPPPPPPTSTSSGVVG